jgi:hypothetical protein
VGHPTFAYLDRIYRQQKKKRIFSVKRKTRRAVLIVRTLMEGAQFLQGVGWGLGISNRVPVPAREVAPRDRQHVHNERETDYENDEDDEYGGNADDGAAAWRRLG